MTLYRLIDEESRRQPVSRLCRTLGVTRSGFYDWQRQPLSDRALADWLLTEQIRQVFEESEQTYGSPRVFKELKLGRGLAIGEKRVARLMRQAGLVSIYSKKRRGAERGGHEDDRDEKRRVDLAERREQERRDEREHERRRESDPGERDLASPQPLEVDLESREEQQKRESDERERLDRLVELDPAERGRADRDPGEELEHDRRQPQSGREAEEERGRERNGGDDRDAGEIDLAHEATVRRLSSSLHPV